MRDSALLPVPLHGGFVGAALVGAVGGQGGAVGAALQQLADRGQSRFALQQSLPPQLRFAFSRVMTAVAPREHLQAARRMRQLLSKVNKARDLIQIGAYQPGHDAELDLAVKLQPQMNALLQQDMHERAALDMSRAQLCRLMPS